jgi:hypothetical protein
MILGVNNLNIKKSDEPLMSDEEIADRIHAVDCFLMNYDRHFDNMANLYELCKLAKAGKNDVVAAVFGEAVSEEHLTALAKQSNEDFWSTAASVAFAGADIYTNGAAGSIKQLVEHILETNKFLSKKFRANVERLKNVNFTDEDVAKARAANLCKFDAWMMRAETIMAVMNEFKKMTAQNAAEELKKIAELCQKIGWRPRFLFKLTGHQTQSLWKGIKERYAVSSSPAGQLGWNAANLRKAIAVADKLLAARIADSTIDVSLAKKQAELEKTGLGYRDFNKAITSVTVAAYHDIGKMVRMVNKLMSKIKTPGN